MLQKKGQGRLDVQHSSHLHQETDLNKRTKKVRPIKTSDFHSFERSPMDFQFRNYMKPTSSSEARKRKLQVAVTSPVSPNKPKNPRSSSSSSSSFSSSAVSASPKAVKILSMNPVRPSMKKNLERATCSSTLKDSKFPISLVLHHGATEAEGASKMRVCPYTYCSLNGYIHEPLPSLKCFISAKKKLLEAKEKLEVGTLFSVKTTEIEEENIGVKEDVISLISSDLYDEIYSVHPKEILREKNGDDISIQEGKHQDQEDSFDCDYDIDQTSQLSLDQMDDVKMNSLEFVEIDDNVKEDREEDEFKQNMEETLGISIPESISSFDLISQPADHNEFVGDAIVSTEPNDLQSFGDESNTVFSKWNKTRKITTKNLDEEKEFNPKPPNFLSLEPDPDTEKVDLRHQMMDGRKNAEEWMIDYALQQAVSHLGGSARKKKVALLVKAFETVVPLLSCEKPLSLGTSAFTHPGYIQACN